MSRITDRKEVAAMKITTDIPVCIVEQMDELTALCNQYPRKVPLGAVADLLGINRASLEAMVMAGRCPFGLGWLKETATNRTFFVSTFKLYTWYMEYALKMAHDDPVVIR